MRDPAGREILTTSGILSPRAKAKKVAQQNYLAPEAQKAIANRLARAEGHLRSIRQMVVDHRCADEILIQIAAVKAALNQTAAAMIDHEMRACATPA